MLKTASFDADPNIYYRTEKSACDLSQMLLIVKLSYETNS